MTNKRKKHYPKVSIVGRPNVGKSSLFNRIIGKRRAIVDAISGVTRDRLSIEVIKYEKPFILIDTGGIIEDDKDFFSLKIKDQAEIAILESDIIIFVVDGKEGLSDLDKDVAKILRKSSKNDGKKILLAVNKIDNHAMESQIGEYYNLGFDDLYSISAIHGHGVSELMDHIIEGIPDSNINEAEQLLHIAVVGRPNVGKSSFVNKVLNEDRVVVSDIPGTTRDSIDIKFQRHGNGYIFIDTAGMRHKRKITDDLEYYSLNRALKSIKRSNITILMIDADQGLTTLELKILKEIHDLGKACLFVINKWDLVSDMHQKDYVLDRLSKVVAYSYVPCVFISALEGKNINKVFNNLEYILQEQEKRISTGVINKFFEGLIKKNPPPIRGGKRFKIYYACQVETGIPTFIISANNQKLLDDSYKRYLENQLRLKFGFEGVPIRIFIKAKPKK